MPSTFRDVRPKGRGRPMARFGIGHLTVGQKRLYEMLIACYKADQVVTITTRTELDLEAKPEPVATASRTVTRGLVTHGLADYSPEGTYLLLSESGKREATIPTRAERHGTTMLEKASS
jgi:hypothetical protein